MEGNVLELFETSKYAKICAPMVRYSKLQFRQLTRLYDCQLAFSPMILADSFVLSDKARANEFTTSLNDSLLIVQFAANNVADFVGATSLVSPFCDGVDLNCGCPQRWAKKLGLGCALIETPELICSMIKECRAVVKKQPFSISVKTRILHDMKRTVDLCQKLDKSGVSFISLHGRTPDQSTGEINSESIKLVQENVSCPVIANGGVETLQDCDDLYEMTKCKGIMVANGLLTNPMMFTGHKRNSDTINELILNWILICYHEELRKYFKSSSSRKFVNILDIRTPANVSFQCFHHHLVFMLSKILNRSQKQKFNNLRTFANVLQFLSEHNLVDSLVVDLNLGLIANHHYDELPLSFNVDDNVYVQAKSRTLKEFKQSLQQENDCASNGKYFSEFTLHDLFSS